MENLKNEHEQMKMLIHGMREEWRLMWWERLDDKLRAEGIASKDYEKLSIEKGLVIFATRKTKQLTFSDVVLDRFPCEEVCVPSVGGWGKFIREVLSREKKGKNSRQRSYSRTPVDKGKCGPLKKGGRGWLHKF